MMNNEDDHQVLGGISEISEIKIAILHCSRMAERVKVRNCHDLGKDRTGGTPALSFPS